MLIPAIWSSICGLLLINPSIFKTLGLTVCETPTLILHPYDQSAVRLSGPLQCDGMQAVSCIVPFPSPPSGEEPGESVWVQQPSGPGEHGDIRSWLHTSSHVCCFVERYSNVAGCYKGTPGHKWKDEETPLPDIKAFNEASRWRDECFRSANTFIVGVFLCRPSSNEPLHLVSNTVYCSSRSQRRRPRPALIRFPSRSRRCITFI